MGEYEDVLEELREGTIDGEEAAERLGKFKGSSLRKKAEERDEFEKRATEAEAKVESLESIPKRQAAFEKAGIDFEALRPAEKALIEQYDGEITDEAIAELVEVNELPLVDEGGSDEEPDTDAERIVSSAKRAGANGGRSPQITPGDIADWTAERWVKFADANQDAAEALRQGKTVTGVTG
jgi:hypothetical protein